MPTAKKPAKKKTVKKAAPKKAVKKVVKKTATKKAAPKKTVKKAAPKKAVAKKTVKKAAPKKAAPKKAAPKKKVAKVKRKPNPAFMKPLTPTAELGAVVGAKPMPRTEVVKKLWVYIKKNNLQDPANKRDIIADDKLKKVFGGKKKVNMFEMTKLVSKHLK